VYASASGNGAASVDVLPPKKKIACFVSGGGSNMKKIYEATHDGRINGEITVRWATMMAVALEPVTTDYGFPVLDFAFGFREPDVWISRVKTSNRRLLKTFC
jgi:phosphoribosylglycinamide formyltransferase